MTDIYQQYRSDRIIQISCKEVYEDKDGYPNSKAFDDFAKKTRTSEKEYFLVCLNVDLRKANEKNYAYGNYILRKFILSLKKIKGCYPFRIQGEKFNILIERDSLDELKNLLARENEYYDLYYGISETAYSFNEHIRQIQTCVEQMYADKRHKRNKLKSDKKLDKIIGDKGNTPVLDRETDTCKNRRTMWYTLVKATVHEPVFKEIIIYIFPTQYCEPMRSIPLVVVADDMLKYRHFYGKNVQFGVGKVLFSINAHFNNDGHLNVSVFNVNSGQCELKVKTIEGSCIPANFGKRFGKGEIYPIKQNIAGYCDFVYLENEEAVLNTTGIIENENNDKYTVHMDSQSIHLMPFQKDK